MTDRITTMGESLGYGASSAQRNKVLRNTYWLLALSMVPTVLGAWVGVATGITQSLNGILGMVVFLGGAFGFIYAIEKTKNSAAGVPVLLGFTFFMGLMLSRMIGHVLGYSNGAQLVFTAFGGTAGVFVVMASLASVIKRDLSGMGKWLFVGARTAARPSCRRCRCRRRRQTRALRCRPASPPPARAAPPPHARVCSPG